MMKARISILGIFYLSVMVIFSSIFPYFDAPFKSLNFLKKLNSEKARILKGTFLFAF